MTVSYPADATINAAGPFCSGDPSINLTAASSGGTWSGSGVTDPITGTFDPDSANTGSNIIYYWIAGLCPSEDSINILVYHKANATINPAGPFCADHPPVTLTAANTGGIWSGYGISDSNAGTFNPIIAGPGIHHVYYMIPGICGDSDTIQLIVFNALSVSANVVSESCEGKADGYIYLTVSGGTSPYVYHWSNGSLTEDIHDLAAGNYSVTVTDTNHCTIADDYTVIASDVPCETPVIVLYLPNIFTPNGDGENDVLYVRGSGIKELSLTIYDRWGEKVFETTDQAKGWDGTFRGKNMDNGVYVYYLKARLVNDKEIIRKGNITLAR
jgi:gliding motility-associated-like protein